MTVPPAASAAFGVTGRAPRALIVRAPGTNCDEETAAAWERAGASCETWHIGRVLERPEALDGFQVVTIPGGFSYGDDLGAGRILATKLAALGEALARFRDRGGLILGICNGFQVLVRSGLLPGDGMAATLARNEKGHFESRWVRLAPRGGRTPFVADDRPIELPVAHGEGRFLTASPDDLARLEAAGQVVLHYADEYGKPTQSYPANPNGSAGAVAGLCDGTGRVFGLMPHPERNIEPTHHPRWTRGGTPAEGDGLRIFHSAVAAFR
jgi:phosphoribosylformylglycinamidine synthase